MMVGCKFNDEVKDSFFDSIVSTAIDAKKKETEAGNGRCKRKEAERGEDKGGDHQEDVTIAMIKCCFEKFK